MPIRCFPAGPVNLANLGLADREVCGDFTHGQQRSGGGGASGQHRVGQRLNLPALDLAVLELAEAILELLEVADDVLVRGRSCSGAKNSSR
jgi:hypothetical protein